MNADHSSEWFFFVLFLWTRRLLQFRQNPARWKLEFIYFLRLMQRGMLQYRRTVGIVKIWIKILFVETRRILALATRITYIVFIDIFYDNDRNFSLPVRYKDT